MIVLQQQKRRRIDCMSKLDELIEELCPDGVEYKTLGDIATITRGGNFQKRIFKRREYLAFTMVKFIHIIIFLQIELLLL